MTTMPARPGPSATRQPGRAPRTGTGARLVDVPEVDPVEVRMGQLGEAKAAHDEAAEAAWQDYRAESAALWLRYQERLTGLAAEYGSAVDAIRGQP